MRLLITIVDRILTDAATNIIQNEGDGYCMEMWGKGTASSEMIDLLGLGSPDKTVIMAIVRKKDLEPIFKRFSNELELTKKGTGIAFSVPINSIGKSSLEYLEHKIEKLKQCKELKERE